MTTPLISVVLPVYNGAADVRKAVESILAQTFEDYELILINDGSKDDTMGRLIAAFDMYPCERTQVAQLQQTQIRQTYASRRFSNLLVVDKENGRKADAANAGLGFARTPLVCVIDADSIIEPDGLLRAAEPFMHDNGRLVAVGGAIRVANGCTVKGGSLQKIDVAKDLVPQFQVVEYLRAFLTARVANAQTGTLMLISHDRDFLDAVCDHILHIDQGQLMLYRGHYSAFERARAERQIQQQAAFEKQQARRAEIEGFVERFRAKATKARQAQSRLKMLERMETIAAARVDSPFRFQLPCADKTSTPLLSLDQASLGYSERTILEGVKASILPGERIGLLGPNGAGKSTLIKTLIGDLPPLAGARVPGENLVVGYYAQHQLEHLFLRVEASVHPRFHVADLALHVVQEKREEKRIAALQLHSPPEVPSPLEVPALRARHSSTRCSSLSSCVSSAEA